MTTGFGAEKSGLRFNLTIFGYFYCGRRDVPVLLLNQPSLLNNDLQVGIRGQQRVLVLSTEQAHFESFSPPHLKHVLITGNSYS